MHNGGIRKIIVLSKVHNGGIRKIIVPGGRFLWGWKKLSDCLDNLVGRRFWKGVRTSNEIRSGNPLTVLDKLRRLKTGGWQSQLIAQIWDCHGEKSVDEWNP